MRQFTGDYGDHRGIIHYGDWVCLYESSADVTGEYRREHARPGYVLVDGSRGGRVSRPLRTPRRLTPTGSSVAEIGAATYRVRLRSTQRWTVASVLSGRTRTHSSVVYAIDVNKQRTLATSGYVYTSPTFIQRGVRGGWHYHVKARPGPDGDQLPFASQGRFGRRSDVVVRLNHARVGFGPGGVLYALDGGTGGHSLVASYPWGGMSITVGVPVRPDVQAVTDFEFSPDGRRLVLATAVSGRPRPEHERTHLGANYLSRAVDLYDVNWPVVSHVARMLFPARYVSFSPDGMTVAALGPSGNSPYSADDTLTVFDME